MNEKFKQVFYASDSDDSEIFSAGPYESIEEALGSAPDDLGLEEENCVVFIGEGKAFWPHIYAWMVLEQLESDAHEECGEISEQWAPCSESKPALEELEASLNLVLEQWMQKHNCVPSISKITNIKRYEVKQSEALSKSNPDSQA